MQNGWFLEPGGVSQGSLWVTLLFLPIASVGTQSLTNLTSKWTNSQGLSDPLRPSQTLSDPTVSDPLSARRVRSDLNSHLSKRSGMLLQSRSGCSLFLARQSSFHKCTQHSTLEHKLNVLHPRYREISMWSRRCCLTPSRQGPG